MTKKLLCYNRGCGKYYFAEDDVEGVCQHHPGTPVFHDAYKGWSCCKKRSTDFTEFLNIPGCSKGLHNPEKPQQVEKPKNVPLSVGEVITDGPEVVIPKPTKKIERPSHDLPKIKLKQKIADSLRRALEKQKEKLLENEKAEVSADSETIAIGTNCEHNGCQTKYESEETNNTECVYHPGTPIFHEGYKFWSCCQKRTSDFDEFLKQAGCECGQHKWKLPSQNTSKKLNCRYDWHQTGKYVIVSIYAKVCDPDKCEILVNSTNLDVNLTFNGGSNVFDFQVILSGVVDPEESFVEYMQTKAEIRLQKANPGSWASLEYKGKS